MLMFITYLSFFFSHQIDDSQVIMERRDLENGEVQIEHSHMTQNQTQNNTDRWLVVKKTLDAKVIAAQVKMQSALYM